MSNTQQKKPIPIDAVECTANRGASTQGIEELAANICAMGLLQPILLADAGGGKWRVVDGRRRFAALKTLTQELTPEMYTVYHGGKDDAAAFVANFARENLTLAEEVEQMRGMYDGRFRASLRIGELARILGRTRQWVALRMNLASLAGQWKTVLTDREKYPQWTPAMLELIAREPASVQKGLEYMLNNGWTISLVDLKRRLEDEHRNLASAPFDTAKCRTCPRRTGAQQELFAEFSDKPDTCLDKACYMRHALAFVKAQKKARPDLILIRGTSSDYGSPPYEYAEQMHALGAYSFEKVRAPKKGETPNALFCTGSEIGRWMVAVKAKPTGKTADAPHEKTLAEREQELKAKRTKLALQKLAAWIESPENTFDAWKTRGHYDDRKTRATALKLAMWYGFAEIVPGLYRWFRPNFPDEGEFDARAFSHASGCIHAALTGEIASTLADLNLQTGPDICGLLFLDYDRFFREAEAEIPAPKSLEIARLRAKSEKKK